MLKFQQKGEKMKKYFQTLSRCKLFSDISAENLTSLLHCLGARIQAYEKRDTIFAHGSSAKYIGILLSGAAQTVTVDYYGNRSILSEATESEMLGESFACAGEEEFPVSVVASERCEVMLVECNRVLHSCANSCSFHHQMIFNLMKNLAMKNIMFHQKNEITSKRTTREKLMAYLMLEAKNHSSDSFEIPFDRQELADYLEVERSGLSAEIGKMRREGIIESRKNHFRIL